MSDRGVSILPQFAFRDKRSEICIGTASGAVIFGEQTFNGHRHRPSIRCHSMAPYRDPCVTVANMREAKRPQRPRPGINIGQFFVRLEALYFWSIREYDLSFAFRIGCDA